MNEEKTKLYDLPFWAFFYAAIVFSTTQIAPVFELFFSVDGFNRNYELTIIVGVIAVCGWILLWLLNQKARKQTP